MVKIQARMILEILGRPKDYMLSALSQLIERLSKENGILILEKKVHEPVHVKDSKDLYTTFVELTLQIDTITQYFGILFAYMPSNIEVIFPESLTLNNCEFNELSIRLAQRLHDYDTITKKCLMEKTIAENKLKESSAHPILSRKDKKPRASKKKK